MKKIKLTFVLFLFFGLTFSHLALAQNAPRCNPDTMKILLNFNETRTFTRFLVSNQSIDGTKNPESVLFKPRGNDFCAGTVTTDTNNFLVAAGTVLTSTLKPMFTFEFKNSVGRPQFIAILMLIDRDGSTGDAVIMSKNQTNGKTEIDSIGQNFFWRQ